MPPTVVNLVRRQTVESTGSCNVYDPLSETPEADAWDVVIDAVGGAATREAASKAVRPGGVVVHIGLMDNNGGLDVRKFTVHTRLNYN